MYSTSQIAGRLWRLSLCCENPAHHRDASLDAPHGAPPAPWLRRSGTPVYEASACDANGRYGPLVEDGADPGDNGRDAEDEQEQRAASQEDGDPERPFVDRLKR